MNWSRMWFFPMLMGVVLFIACNGHKKNSSAVSGADPILRSDPSLKIITQQIDNTPKDASLFFKRGQLLHKMKRDSLALSDFKTATTLDTTKSEYYSAIGDLLFDHRDINGSVQWLQKALALNPSDVKARLKVAKLMLYINDFKNGFAQINIVLRANPYNAEAYFLKGMFYKEMKDTGKAISSFETAKSIDPDYEDAVEQIGVLYSAQNNPLALSYFDNALKIDSTDVYPIFAKGVFYQNQKDYVKAKQQFRECIVRNTHYVDAYFRMGYILLQQDSLEKAYRQYDIVVKVDPENSSGYYDRGLCSELMDSIPKAIEDYKMALMIDSTYKSPKEGLMRLRAQRKDKQIH